MSLPMSLAVALHVLAAIVWVGGMFFAHQCLRPALSGLEPPQRLRLMAAVLKRFFGWVGLAILLLLLTGLGEIALQGGFAAWGPHVHLMFALGIIMMLLFGHVYFAPNRRLQAAVAQADWSAAARHLDLIRRLVGINLLLGLVTAAIGASGRYW